MSTAKDANAQRVIARRTPRVAAAAGPLKIQRSPAACTASTIPKTISSGRYRDAKIKATSFHLIGTRGGNAPLADAWGSVYNREMSLVVVGSVAYDGVETPHGRVARMLGGSA